MASNRMIRGGGFANDASTQRAAARYYFPPLNRYHDVGLRCARTL